MIAFMLALAPAIVVENATIWVTPEQKLEDATLVVRDGRVVAAGRGVAVPAGATRVDGRGTVVTAGLIDAHARFGAQEIDEEPATIEGSFPGSPADPVHAAYRIDWGWNPSGVGVDVARAGGLTSAIVVPRGGLVAGRSAWFSLVAGAPAPVVVRGELAMHAALGQRALGPGLGSRAWAMAALRELLADAQIYARRRAAFEENRARRLSASRMDLEALVPVAQGRTPLVVDVRRASDIAQVIELKRALGLRVVLVHATEAWRLAPELARERIPVILSPQRNLPGTFDELWVRDDAATILAAAGVTLILAPLDDPTQAHTLRQMAGIAVAHGLPWSKALAAITTAPAEVFGVAPRGRLSPGAPADFVVWSGDPFELSTRVKQIYIGGVAQPLTNHQTELLRRYRRLPAAP